MKLVKFKNHRNEDIYINPDSVVGVAGGEMYLLGREECILVNANADEIISKIEAEVYDID